MNDRAKQVLIVLVAARLIPWVQKVFKVTLTMEDIGDLFVLAMAIWHSGAALICAIIKRYFPSLATVVTTVEINPQEIHLDPKVLTPPPVAAQQEQQK